MGIAGRKFWKMSGSGNDFVVFDIRTEPAGGLDAPELIQRLCSRSEGIGADGVVFLEPNATEPFGIRYYNSDGSRGELCGNASLCTTSLAVRLGLGGEQGVRFHTDVGAIAARIAAGEPEIDLQPPRDLRVDAGIALDSGEQRIGFIDTGVPHLVVLTDNAEAVPILTRGAELRRHPSLKAGANVNFVSRGTGGDWRMRTFERGVEGETLACGTGSVASAVLLTEWRLAEGPSVRIRTSSGKLVTVTLRPSGAGHIQPSLRGEGRIVFTGQVGEI